MSFDIVEKICRGSRRPQPVPSAKKNPSWAQDVATAQRSPFPAQGPRGSREARPWPSEPPGAPERGSSNNRLPPPQLPSPFLGYTWCFNKCFLFDFLIFVFSEKALASSNSFLRVAGRKQRVRVSPQDPSQSCPGEEMARASDARATRAPVPHGNAVGLPGNTRAARGSESRVLQPSWSLAGSADVFTLSLGFSWPSLPTTEPPTPSVSAGCSPTQAAQRPRSILRQEKWAVTR